jgi:hypothetical protein
MNKLLFLPFGVGATLLALAGVASADATTDAVSDIQDTLVGYAAPVAVAIAGVVAVFIGLPLIRRFASMIRNAVG